VLAAPEQEPGVIIVGFLDLGRPSFVLETSPRGNGTARSSIAESHTTTRGRLSTGAIKIRATISIVPAIYGTARPSIAESLTTTRGRLIIGAIKIRYTISIVPAISAQRIAGPAV